MEYGIDFKHVRSQKLLLIPQLKQAIEVLEMSSGELFQFIEGQLETNPALEQAPDKMASEGLHTDFDTVNTNDYEQDSQSNDHFVEVPEKLLSLKQYLLLQYDALCPDKCSFSIGEYLIDNIDENGYLKVDIVEAAAFFDVPEALVLEVLVNLQGLDPPGVCARDLRECLLIQLRQHERQDFDAILVVDRYLNAVADDDPRYVAESTGLSISRVIEAFKVVKSLEPIPGREYCNSEVMTSTLPDIIVQDTKEDLHVIYNGEAFPNVCISEDFMAKPLLLGAKVNRKRKDWINSAAWLIKCLEQREDIIFTIAQKICEFRREFFKRGPKTLKLINKNSFASSLYLHESILDKALAGKYLQCRWGMYELRSFFSDT